MAGGSREEAGKGFPPVHEKVPWKEGWNEDAEGENGGKTDDVNCEQMPTFGR